MSNKQIEYFVEKHQSWIIQKVNQAEKNPKRSLQYTNGEQHYYLGKPYCLDLRMGSEETIGLSDSYLVMVTKNQPTPASTKNFLYKWYRQQAQRIFWERLEECFTVAHFHGIKEQPTIRIKLLKSRWGSCSSRGNINLNLELIKSPIACIDHTIFHELCHLKHMNHGKNFYDLLTQMMPDWKIHRTVLKQISRGF